jgi:membrane protein DedA with SNARE-associated domain
MAKWVISVISSTHYIGLVFLMAVENVFPPIPSEVIMPLAGYMVTQGKLSFLGIIIAGTIGSVLGALPLYYAGSRLEEERLKKLADRHGRWLTISRRDMERAKRWFERHGGMAVLFCRLVPGVRSLISLPAGVEKMNLAVFLGYTAIGSAIWTALLASLGYFLGSNFGEVEEYLEPASWVILGGILVFYIVRVLRQKGQPATVEKGAS